MIELKTISYTLYENTRMSMCYKTSASSPCSQLDILIDLEVGTNGVKAIRDKLCRDVRGAVKTLVDNYSGSDDGNIRILANNIVEQVTYIASPFGSSVYVVWRVEANNLFDDFIVASSKNKSAQVSTADADVKSEPVASQEFMMTEFWFKFISTMHFNLIEMIKSKSIRLIGKFSSLTYSNENEEWCFTPHRQKDKVVCVHYKDTTDNLTGAFDVDFSNEDGITFDLIEGMSGGEFRNATLKREMCNALLNLSSIESES